MNYKKGVHKRPPPLSRHKLGFIRNYFSKLAKITLFQQQRRENIYNLGFSNQNTELPGEHCYTEPLGPAITATGIYPQTVQYSAGSNGVMKPTLYDTNQWQIMRISNMN